MAKNVLHVEDLFASERPPSARWRFVPSDCCRRWRRADPDYRALVCVFLFGGNDSNNTVIPMDDASFQAYTSIRGSLALTAQRADADRHQRFRSAVSHFTASCAEVASLFSSKELAVVANVGPLVQPLTRAQYQTQQAGIPLNLFSHSDQQLAWQTSIAQGHSPTGWAGRAADYIASQNINSSSFPTFFSVAGNILEGNGVEHTAGGAGAGTIAARWLDSTPPRHRRRV